MDIGEIIDSETDETVLILPAPDDEFGEFLEKTLNGYAKDEEVAESELSRLSAQLAELEALVYVPGTWKCAKCGCVLVSSTLNADTGLISANVEPQRCPNDCGPMWRRTEREAGNELCDRLDVVAEKAIADAATIATLQEDNARLLKASHDAALALRPALQSFDNGGESFRSLRSRGVETAYRLLSDHDDPTFSERAKIFDENPWNTINGFDHDEFLRRTPDIAEKIRSGEVPVPPMTTDNRHFSLRFDNAPGEP